MKIVTKHLYGWPSFVLHSAIIPLFFFVFVLLYNPVGFQQFLDMGRGLTVFNLTMLSCILLGVVVLFRLLLHFLKEVMPLNYVLYSCWCNGEILIFSGFAAMFLCLMSGRSLLYFSTLLKCLGTFELILVFPFSILALSIAVHGYVAPDSRGASSEGDVIKFRDDRQIFKLALSAGAILYIEAAENYVVIHYLEHDNHGSYTLRTSMKKIEDLVCSRGLVRCHRAYFINPSHVTLLRRDPKGGIYAEVNCHGVPHIPVSKTYYDRLSSIL